MAQDSIALVTGGSGFAGTYLVEFLRTRPDLTVWTCDRTGPSPLLGPSAAARHIRIDLLNPGDARQLMAEVRPDYVYHLAGQAFVGQSWSDPWGTMEINVRAQLNLLEAALGKLDLDDQRSERVSFGREDPGQGIDEVGDGSVRWNRLTEQFGCYLSASFGDRNRV